MNIPPPSWEIFDICDTCGTDKKKPCYNLRKSTSKNLVPTTTPHAGRKRLPVPRLFVTQDPWHPAGSDTV